jgi:hypothetical protein
MNLRIIADAGTQNIAKASPRACQIAMRAVIAD